MGKFLLNGHSTERFQENQVILDFQEEMRLQSQFAMQRPEIRKVLLIGRIKESNCFFHCDFLPFELFEMIFEAADLYDLTPTEI